MEHRKTFGNPTAPGLPYARGALIRTTEDDIVKQRHAWAIIRDRQLRNQPVLNFTGLERGMAAEPDDILEDEMAAALGVERLNELALAHMGGDPARHDVALLNRQTAAILVAVQCMGGSGETVVGVSPRYSHPCVLRAVAWAGARFVDTVGAAGLREALERLDKVSLVVLTRLSVSYEILPERDLHQTVELAGQRGARVLIDDAGGARVGPAVFDQPLPMQLGAAVASTGLDKYGTVGPRLGLLVGEAEIVSRIRARAFEMGLEARAMLYPAVVRSLAQYRPERVRELVATTGAVGEALKRRLGNRVTETPVTAQLRGEDILEMAMERAGLETIPLVPIEATAGLAMLLLREHGILTVHLAAIPPGTSAILIKFVPPETLARLGGPEAFAAALDHSLDRLAELIADERAIRSLLFGTPAPSGAEALAQSR